MKPHFVLIAVIAVAGLVLFSGVDSSDPPPLPDSTIPGLTEQAFADLPRRYAEQLVEFRQRFEAGEVQDYAGELKAAIDAAQMAAFGDLIASVNQYELDGNDDERRIELLRQLMEGSRNAAQRYRE